MNVRKLVLPLALALGLTTAHAEITAVTAPDQLGTNLSYESFDAPGDATVPFPYPPYHGPSYDSIHYASGATLRLQGYGPWPYPRGLQYVPGAILTAAVGVGGAVFLDFTEVGGVNAFGARFGVAQSKAPTPPDTVQIGQGVTLYFADGSQEFFYLASVFGPDARLWSDFSGFRSTQRITGAYLWQGTSDATLDDLYWSAAPVPEPGTLALVALGMAGIAVRRR